MLTAEKPSRDLLPAARRPWGCYGSSEPRSGSQSAAIDPREGLPVVSWEDARQVTRQRAIVFGTVVDVGGTDNIQFLNFSKSDRSAFKIVIFARSLPSFPRPLRRPI